MVHRSIDCSTWDDPWFAELQPKAKLLFLFLITNRRVSQCGAMEITIRQIAFETGLTSAEIPNLIDSFGDRVKWWPDHSLLFVRNFYKHQRANTGDKFDVAARKSVELLPDFAKAWVWGVYPHLRWADDTQAIPTPVPTHSHGISEAEAEAEAEAGVGTTTDTVVAPNRGSRIPDDFALDDDLRRWANGKGFSPPEVEHHTERFVAYWHAESGARAAKKDWKQAWRTWLLRETPGRWRPPLASVESKGVNWSDPVQVEAYRRNAELQMLRQL